MLLAHLKEADEHRRTALESSTIARSIGSNRTAGLSKLLRKEVIQPQVPLRLPCYDFIPVTAHSVDGCFPLLGWRAGFGYK